MTEKEINKKLENKKFENVGTIMKKTYKKSRIIYTDGHHDCFSRNRNNDYVVLQVMFAGVYNGTPMFIVEYMKGKDYSGNYVSPFVRDSFKEPEKANI